MLAIIAPYPPSLQKIRREFAAAPAFSILPHISKRERGIGNELEFPRLALFKASRNKRMDSESIHLRPLTVLPRPYRIRMVQKRLQHFVGERPLAESD